MPEDARQLLTESIARNCPFVLSLPSAGLLRHHKSRFLVEKTEGLWIEVPGAERVLIDELIASQTPVGVAFKSGETKVVFASRALRLDLDFSINDQTRVSALLIGLPDKIEAVQRRDAYRVRLPAGCPLRVRAWRIAPGVYIGDRPQPSQELLIEPRDLSLGGIGVILRGKGGQPPKISTEDRVRVEITHGDATLLLEARMRQPSGPQPDGGISSGLQFKDLAGDLEGRHKLNQLTRLLGEMQREEVRQARRKTG